jgi:aryl-alcohol dehydrogenase-like predicted oxidoreductase
LLGTTGLVVSPIGLGLAALGRPAYLTPARGSDLGEDRSVEALRRRAHEVLDAAVNLGVRYVDAARSYGRAEEFLASWLQTRPEAEVAIGSKWGYRYVGDWRIDASPHEVKDHSFAALRAQWEDTRRMIGDRLDLYQIHSATEESGVLEDRTVLRELCRLRADTGVVMGISLSGPRQGAVLRRALTIEVDGTSPFSSVQATWNLLEQSVGPALEEAAAAGWGVIVKEALANGRLAGREAPPPLIEIARDHQTGPDAVALAAVLTRPWVHIALSGAVTTEQVRSNAAATELRLGEDELARLEALAEDPEVYWTTRSARPWT